MATYQYFPHRGISRDTMEAYGIQSQVHDNGTPLSISFGYGSTTIHRSLQEKKFWSTGDSSAIKLFGQDKFQAGGSKYITITEGAYDALSLYELLRYPAVSVRSASTAGSDCAKAWHYLNSFESLYICFDADKAGEAAAAEVASLFDVNKVYFVKLTKWKDANEAIQSDAAELKRTWYNAKKYQPENITSDIRSILDEEDNQAIATYPFPTLDHMAYGIRPSELVLFTALEKVGKTEVLRAIEYHLLKTTQENLGIIHLEERTKRSVQGLIGYHLNAPVHLPDSGVTRSDSYRAYDEMVQGRDRVFYYSHFGSEDPKVILGAIRYMVSVNKCKFVFLDHITMLVTGFEDDDERRKLDYLSTKLAEMTRELNFTLFMVSHVNDQGQTRGSRNIAKVADLIVHLERDIEQGSNQTRITCRGNRFAGLTGPSGILTFNSKTFTLKELDDSPIQTDRPELAQAEVLEVVQGVQPSPANWGGGSTTYEFTLPGAGTSNGTGTSSPAWPGPISQ